MRRSLLFGVALVVVGSLTACGGGSGKKAAVTQPASTTTSTAAPATTSTTAPASTSTTQGDAAAKAKARSLLLVQGDFPAGWTGSATSTSAQDRQDNKDLAACTGGADPDVAYAADENGLDFAQGASAVSSNASVSRTDADYRKDVAAVQGPKLEPCFKQKLTQVVQREGGTVKQVVVERFAVERHGTLAIGIRATVTISQAGRDATVVSDLVLYGKPRTELTLTFTSPGSRFDPALEGRLASIAGRRLDAA